MYGRNRKRPTAAATHWMKRAPNFRGRTKINKSTAKNDVKWIYKWKRTTCKSIKNYITKVNERRKKKMKQKLRGQHQHHRVQTKQNSEQAVLMWDRKTIVSQRNIVLNDGRVEPSRVVSQAIGAALSRFKLNWSKSGLKNEMHTTTDVRSV